MGRRARRWARVACGGAAYDSLRLEKGYRLWGQDIDEEHDPYEAGLGWAVRLGKDADFIGREAAAAVAERGVTRRLCCLVTDDPAVMLVGKEPLLDGDAPGRLRDERRLRRDAGREHRSTATCRSSAPSPARCSPCTAPAPTIA